MTTVSEKPTSGEVGLGLTLDRVTAYYNDPTRSVLHDVSLSIPLGQTVALLGPNGAGKSTVLRTIVGRTRIAAGAVELDGESLVGIAPAMAIARGISYVPEGQRVWVNMTVMENIQTGAYARTDRVQAQTDLEATLNDFPALKPLLSRPAGTLSGGERQMVALARALMGRPKFLLLDEPSLGLAPGAMDVVFQAIARVVCSRVIGCIIVEQNARQALEIADRACVLQLGQVRLDAPVDEISWERDLEPIYFGDAK